MTKGCYEKAQSQMLYVATCYERKMWLYAAIQIYDNETNWKNGITNNKIL